MTNSIYSPELTSADIAALMVVSWLLEPISPSSARWFHSLISEENERSQAEFTNCPREAHLIDCSVAPWLPNERKAVLAILVCWQRSEPPELASQLVEHLMVAGGLLQEYPRLKMSEE